MKIIKSARNVSLLTIAIGLAVIGFVCSSCGPSATIVGDTAKVHLNAGSTDSPSGLASQVADAIWATAQKNPNVKKVEVTLEYTGEVWGDEHGNLKKGPFIMGTITETDLDELRQFKSKSIWANVGKLGVWGVYISGMDYALLLKKD